MRSVRTALVAGCAVLVLGGLSGCGDGSISLPTARPSLSVSVPTFPSRTSEPASPTPTSETPTATPTSETPTPTPTSETPTPTPSTETPTPTPTSPTPTPTTETPTPTPTSETPTPTPTSESPTPTSASPSSASPSVEPTSASPSASPEAGTGGETSTVWWPWILAAVVVVALILWWFLLMVPRRRWDAAFAADLSEARWVMDSLVPSVTDRTLPADQVGRQWLDGKRRLDDLQSDLYRLGANPPNTARATHLGTVSGSLAALQQSLERDVALRTGPETPTTARDLDANLQTIGHQRDTLLAAVENRPTGPGHAAA